MTADAVTKGLRGLDPAALDGTQPALLHRLADALVDAHRAAPHGDAAAFLHALEATAATEGQRAELTRGRDLLRRRVDGGRIRRLAGDRSEDVLSDLARPLVELIRDGHRPAANILANRYADVMPQGATGWALLPLFLSHQAAANDARALAELLLSPAPARLVVIGGLSGTGKSTLARLLGHHLGRGAGARTIRSDVFRKRLAGVAPEKRLPPSHYTRASDEETYAAMFDSADDHLGCGSSVILEGVFMRRSERDVAEAVADRARVAFTGIWLEAPEQDRLARIEARRDDASDAGAAVVRLQSRERVGEVHWHRIRTNRPFESVVAAARAATGRAQS